MSGARDGRHVGLLAYTRFCDWLSAVMRGIALTALTLIVLSLAAQVFFRYVLKAPLSHTDEIAQTALTWLTFAGAAALYRERGHIEIDLLTARLPPRRARALAIGVELAIMASLALIAAQVIDTRSVMQRVVYGTLQLPKFVLQFIPLLVSCVATILFGAEAVARHCYALAQHIREPR